MLKDATQAAIMVHLEKKGTVRCSVGPVHMTLDPPLPDFKLVNLVLDDSPSVRPMYSFIQHHRLF
jgi:hypothetical protein